MSSTVLAVSFDARDAQSVASFWAAVLGRTVADGANADNAAINADPAVPGSRIAFHRVPEGKTVKNRMHFDLITTDFDAEIITLGSVGSTVFMERIDRFKVRGTPLTLHVVAVFEFDASGKVTVWREYMDSKEIDEQMSTGNADPQHP